MKLTTAPLKVSPAVLTDKSLMSTLDPAGELGWQPLDHSRIVADPSVLKQLLLEEAVLRIEDQDLRARLELLEIIRDQRSALATGRADNEKGSEGIRSENPPSSMLSSCCRRKLGLWPGNPGMWHDFCCGLVVALDGVEFESDTRGEHQPVMAACRRS